MLISTQSLRAAANGNFENIPEESRELVRLRLEAKKRYTVKVEINQKVRARQYVFYKDTVICSCMVKGGEEIFLLPSFHLVMGALADQLHELLPETDAHADKVSEGHVLESEMTDTSAATEENKKLAEFDFAQDVTLANFDSVLKSFARAASLFYLSPSEADFSIFSRGTDNMDFLYAFLDNDQMFLYLGKNEKLSISRCSAKTIFTLLLENLFRIHREEILALNRKEV